MNSYQHPVRCSYSCLSTKVFTLDLSNFIDEHCFEILNRVSKRSVLLVVKYTVVIKVELDFSGSWLFKLLNANLVKNLMLQAFRGWFSEARIESQHALENFDQFWGSMREQLLKGAASGSSLTALLKIFECFLLCHKTDIMLTLRSENLQYFK